MCGVLVGMEGCGRLACHAPVHSTSADAPTSSAGTPVMRFGSQINPMGRSQKTEKVEHKWQYVWQLTCFPGRLSVALGRPGQGTHTKSAENTAFGHQAESNAENVGGGVGHF